MKVGRRVLTYAQQSTSVPPPFLLMDSGPTLLTRRRFNFSVTFFIPPCNWKVTEIDRIEMLSFHSCGCCRVSTSTAFHFQFRTLPSSSLFLYATSYKFRSTTASAGSGLTGHSDSDGDRKLNFSGVRLEEAVDSTIGSAKLRLDSWISSRINGISRARVQSSIKSGLVHVNGRVVDKVISESRSCTRFWTCCNVRFVQYWEKLQLPVDDQLGSVFGFS